VVNLDEIEYLRQIMHVTVLEKGISHPDVLLASRRIDEAVNEYYNAELLQKGSIGEKPIEGDAIHPRRQAILDFIRNYPHQYSPTVREIGAGVGLRSSSSVQGHIDKLVEHGYVERRPKCARCIVIKSPLA
jgi:DNA-binding MarR family transcriptional regulator